MEFLPLLLTSLFYNLLVSADSHSTSSSLSTHSFSSSSSTFDPVVVVGSSCVLEAYNLTSGSLDQEASDACGKCFEEAGEDLARFRNCSEKYLPAMSSICSTHLVQEDQHSFWDSVLTCFNSLVQEWDEGGKVQAIVREYNEEMKKKWELLIGASCLAESKNPDDGIYCNDHLKKCNQCWHQLVNASAESMVEMTRNCTEHFLPHSVECPEVLFAKGEKEAMKCYSDVLNNLDPLGEAWSVVKMTEKVWDDKWEFVLGSSCIANSIAKGQMDDGEACGKCFETDESIDGFVSCTAAFLPSMVNCSALVTDWTDFYSMAVLQCFNNQLQVLDPYNEAQKIMSEYMENKTDSWRGMLMTMAVRAWTALVTWLMS